MIKINLLGDSTVIDRTAKIEFASYCAAIGVAMTICFGLYTAIVTKRSSLTAESETLNIQLTALKEQTKEVRDLERKRQDLFSKLEVIASLRRSKKGPVRVLDDLNRNLPLRSWVTEIVEKDANAIITGVALDNQTIASFMQDLEKSDYYDNIELDETKQAEREGIGVKSFVLRAKVSYSGKALIEESALSANSQNLAKAP